MSTKWKNKLFCAGFMAAMAWTVTVSAQDKPADNMQILVDKVRADKKTPCCG